MSTEDQYLNLQRDALGRAGYTKSTHDRQAIRAIQFCRSGLDVSGGGLT